GYYNGRMTMYEYQPAAAAYYSGVSYFPKGLLTANTPWSGFYDLDSGVWLSAHFTRFIKGGWRFADSGCFGDGKEEHFITDTTNNYMTAADPVTGDYTIVICNDSAETRSYKFALKNMLKADVPLDLWESRGPEKGQPWNENFLRKIRRVQILNSEFSIDVKPFSIVTLTTLEKDEIKIPLCEFEDVPLDVNYSDSFDYSADFLAARGNAPLYTTDYGGAFEVARVDGENVLMQMIDKSIKPTDWYKKTPPPITVLGDDRWRDYSAEIEFRFDSPEADNYISLGVRYLTSDLGVDTAENGYSMNVFPGGKWEMKKNLETVLSGTLADFGSTAWHTVKITAAERNITAEIDGKTAAEFTDNEAYANSGRVSIGSGLYKNIFRKFKTASLDGLPPFVVRLDDHDPALSYSGEWERLIAQHYTHFNRTLSRGGEGCFFEFEFEGGGFAVIGETEEAEIKIYDNGEFIETAKVRKAIARQCGYSKSLPNGKHKIKLAVQKGNLTVDAVEYYN
ncbi:MAG: hypothetical protein NC192_05750, partial [Muribaculaceae bacterium]|nr:hypothetical protein [Muribaculaceae bacterium]